MARVAPDKRETSSASPHSTLDETLDGVCMFKFLLIACIVTKAECVKSIEVVEADAFREGFFVRAVCQELK